MRFSGHESFACRYAWLPKAYRAIAKDDATFLNEEQAMVSLGVGKNMVRSIRFWVEVMGVAVPRPDRTLGLTDFAHAVLADDGFDSFLEDRRTLWLLHWNVATRVEGPLFAWDYLLYRWPYAEFTRSEALSAFMRESRQLNTSHSEVTLGQHLDVFLHTYVSARGEKALFEDSLDCPLAELELLQKVGERRIEGSGRREPIYAFRREAKPEITVALFEYCLDDHWRKRHDREATLTFRHVATEPGGPGQVFRLPEDDIRTRLDGYILSDPSWRFIYQPSAVQGLVSRRDLPTGNLLQAIYKEEVKVG